MGLPTRQMLVLLCAVLAGCGGDDDAEVDEGARTQPVEAAPRIEPLTDAQAVGVLSAMSTAAVEAARTPAPLIARPELRRLVDVVRADHQALQAELKAISDSLQVTPVEHAAAARVRSAGQAAMLDTAQAEYGTADETVLQQQIELLTTLLSVMDSVVLPGLQQQTLVTQYARASRPTLAAHLQRARQLELLLREPVRTAEPAPASVPRPQGTAPPARIDTTVPPPAPPDTGAARRYDGL